MNVDWTESTTVAGIDVGGARKGFHVVALRGGQYLAKVTTREPAAVAEWCREVGASAVGIDAPCRWSSTGRGRSAERALAARGIHCFATPREEAAQGRPFYQWMRNGADLFRLIESDYPLFKGPLFSGRSSLPVCFETFPQAIACALAGEVVSAKNKRVVRRELLRAAGIDTASLTNIDFVDAALCALAARYFVVAKHKCHGDAVEGYIVVPAPAK